MKRLVFAIGVLALTYGASAPARADFAVARFPGDWCRVWVDADMHPYVGHYLHWVRRVWVHGWWRHHHHHGHWIWVRYDRFPTWEAADHHLHWAFDEHRCHP